MQILLWNGEPIVSLGGADIQLGPVIYSHSLCVRAV